MQARKNSTNTCKTIKIQENSENTIDIVNIGKTIQIHENNITNTKQKQKIHEIITKT